ncbi:MAG: ParB/RepB/Spo0J family partition protein [Rikenellaceae bacterium]
MKSLGLIQPITVAEEENGKYTIISGERRYRASLQAGLKMIPVYVRKVDDTQMLEMALVENVQREELNALEIAHCLNRLMEECNMTQEGLSKRIGKQRSTIANYVRLLRLPVEVQLALQRNLLSMGHARALLSMDDSKAIVELADRVVSEGLSVRQVESIVKKGKGKKGVKKVPATPEYFPILASKMKSFMSHDVDIRRASDGKTRITISVNSDDEVAKLLQKFENI